MLEKTRIKIISRVILISLYLVIAIASICGIILISIIILHTDDYRFIALIVVLTILLMGAVYGASSLSLRKGVSKTDRIQKSVKNLLIWLIVAVGTGGGAVGAYYNAWRLRMTAMIGVFHLAAILNVICFYSLFILIFGIRQKKAKATEVKKTSEDEITIKKN